MASIQVTLNDTLYILSEPLNIRQAVLQLLGGEYDCFAVWINGGSVLQAEYDSRLLLDGDKVSVIHICAGG